MLREDTPFELVFLGIVFLITFLGSLPDKISTLRYATFVSSGIAVVLALTLISQSTDVKKHYQQRQPQAAFRAAKLDCNLFGGYVLAMFSVVNQFAVVNILAEFNDPTPQRIAVLLLGGAVFPVVLYLSVAVAGFASCGDQCPDLIVNRHNEGKDVVMTLCRISLLSTLIIGLIIRVHTVNSTISVLQGPLEAEPVHRETCQSLIDTPAEIDLPKFEENEENSFDADTASTAPSRKDVVEVARKFMIAFIPALIAALVRKYVLDYLVSAFGFLAPLFIVIFPCKAYLDLASDGRIESSPSMTKFVKNYLWIGASFSYCAFLLRSYFRLAD